MLTELHVENFKAWRELKLGFGKITALFGENSSGKSSLLQFLLMLKQTKNAADRGLVLDFGGGPAGLVNLRSYEAAVHRSGEEGSVSSDMKWTLKWRLPTRLRFDNPLAGHEAVSYEGNELQLTTCVGPDGDGSRIFAKQLQYGFAGTTFELIPKESGGKFELTSGGDHPFRFVRNVGRGWPLPGPVKTHLFPDAARNLFQNTGCLSDFENAYEGLMDKLYYLGPLRKHPEPHYGWTGAGREGVGDSGEFTIDAILAATERRDKQNLRKYGRKKGFQELVAHWLQELDLIHSFQVREVAEGSSLYQVLVRRDSSSPETTLSDVGFGVSQVLPVLVLLYYVPAGSIVLMEQPEIHLHPSVQSGLADVMLAVAGHRQVQIVVESHSEHLLRRFQRRVAEGTVAASDLKLHFVRSKDGTAHLDSLRLNEWGGIENWPDNFFGDEMGEIAATTRAGLERRMGAG